MLEKVKEKALQEVTKAIAPTIIKALEDAEPLVKATAIGKLKEWDLPYIPENLEKPLDEFLGVLIAEAYVKTVESIESLLLNSNK